MQTGNATTLLDDRPVRFALGDVCATPQALRTILAAGIDPCELLARHERGDWGDICAEDQGLNDIALERAERILSIYPLSAYDPAAGDARVFIITEWDRSTTTILMSGEY